MAFVNLICVLISFQLVNGKKIILNSSIIIKYIKLEFYSKGDLSILNNSPQYKLQNRLLSGYKTGIRPVFDINTKTNITLDFTLLQLLSMVYMLNACNKF